MPKFLFEATYTVEGVKGIQSAGGTSRREAVAQVAESVGGSLESFYFAFGDRDAYVICDLPGQRERHCRRAYRQRGGSRAGEDRRPAGAG